MAKKEEKKRGGLLGNLPTPKLPGIGSGGDDKQQSRPGSGPSSFGTTQQGSGGSRFGGGRPGQGPQSSSSGGIGGRLGIGGKSGGGSGEKQGGGLLGGRLGFGGGGKDDKSTGGRSSGPSRPGGGGLPGRSPGGSRPGGSGPGRSRPGGSGPGGSRPGGSGPSGSQQSSRIGGGLPGRSPGGSGPGGSRPGGSSPGGSQSGSRFGGGSQPGGSGPGGSRPGGSRPGGPQQGGSQSSSRFGGGNLPGRSPGGSRPSSSGPGGSRPGGPQQGGSQSSSRFGGGSQPGGSRPGSPQQGGSQSSSRFGGGNLPGRSPGGSRPGGSGPGGSRPGSSRPGGSGPGSPQQGGSQSSSRFGGGNLPGRSPGGSRPGGSGSGGSRPSGSGPGGSRPSGTRPGSPSSGGQQSRPGSSSKLPPPPGGRSSSGTTTQQKTTTQQQGKQRKRAKTTAARTKSRTTSKKKKQDTLLSLDTKLDILGVVLVVTAVILVLSFLSKEPGTLTGFVLTVIRQLFGWGAFLVPIPVGAAGVWLILRRFEDRLPDIEPLRLIGGTVAFVAALTGVHFFVLLFNPNCPAPPDVVQPAYRIALCGHGGGLTGAFMYTTLHNLIGGGGVFVTFVAAGLVGAMLAAELTAKEAVELGMRGYQYLRKGAPATAFVRTKSGTMKPVQAEGEADEDGKDKDKAEAKSGNGKTASKPEDSKAKDEKAAEGDKPKEKETEKDDEKAKPGMPKLPGIGEKAPAAATAGAAKSASASAAGGLAAGAGASVAATPAPRPAPSRPAPSRPSPGGPGLPSRPGAPSPPGGGPSTPFPGPQGRELPLRERPASPAPKPSTPTPDDGSDGASEDNVARAGRPVPPPPRPVTPPPRPSARAQPPVAAPPRPGPSPSRPAEKDTPEDEKASEPEEEGRTSFAATVVPPSSAPPKTPDKSEDEPEKEVEAKTEAVAEAVASEEKEAEAEQPVEAKPEPTTPTPTDGKGDDVFAGEYVPPPAPTRKGQKWEIAKHHDVLKPGVERSLSDDELRRRAEIIENTLASFGAPGRVVEVNQGPVITQFGVEPDYIESRSGKRTKVKVGKISALADDIALALAAPTIRIEAPVPGKGYIGVEVPNPEPSLVSLREIMDADEWSKIDSPLKIGLGMDVSGTAVAADLTAMPHLLVAGTTGSGKSVCVNGIISALLLTRTPDELKMIMVDPKRVELTNYNGIPHLMAPVVTELERIVGVLKWVQREMDERYRKFAMAGARNIADFNRRAEKKGEDKLFYIVVIVDELADLMMLAPDETERVVTRLAQMARATGIHIIISTQRPSVDVVTGLIKANFPARIAFAVPTGVDSRVILDMPGAERLLGRGDMLFQAPDAAMPLRLQGTFVSDEEIDEIVDFWRKQGGPTPPPAAATGDGKAGQAGKGSAKASATTSAASPATAVQRPLFVDDEEDSASSEDALFDEAVSLARDLGKISISLLQRRLRIGYTRAARLIDLMEEQEIIGPHEGGSKPRKVLTADDKKSEDKETDDEEDESDSGEDEDEDES